VAEPSAADTVQILRGISDKYATFHGVRVQDRALVAAAELSERYIQGRFRASPCPLSFSPPPSCPPLSPFAFPSPCPALLHQRATWTSSQCSTCRKALTCSACEALPSYAFVATSDMLHAPLCHAGGRACLPACLHACV
jgi:hypothetical protein